ncbi:hypothetical protein BJ912DRAFT_966029 [Pholiota molesta]|nr:hypothetical protein BJ912DRAFT_966029 [Pholiota molesta]
MARANTASTRKTRSTPTKAPKAEKTAVKAKKRSKADPPADPDSDSSQSDVEVFEDDTASANCKIDWTDADLNFTLLNAITNDRDIKEGLYPSPGGNMTTIKSGGNKKRVWQWKLAVEIFQAHPKYKAAFSRTLNCTDAKTASKLQTIWSSKIKNRLTRMASIAREHIATLGQTGEGIRTVEDVDMSRNNEFTNKWSEIIAECPWFLQMRDLIAQRPNIIPVGIGNSSSDIDFSVLQDTSISNDTETEATSDGYDILNDNVAMELAETSEAEQPEASDQSFNTKKRRAVSTTPEPEDVKPDVKPKVKTETKVTGPRASTSKPASTAPVKKRSRLEEFSIAAQAEEQTRQKELELNKAKLEASARLKIENSERQRDIIKAKVELKKQDNAKESAKIQAKKEIMIEKLRLRHEFKLAELRMKAQPQFNNHHPSASSSTIDQRQDLVMGFDQFNNFPMDDVQPFSTIDNTFLPNSMEDS